MGLNRLNSTAQRLILAISSIIFILSLYLVNLTADRTGFGFIASFYTLGFIAYLILYRFRDNFNFRTFVFIAIAAQLVSLWHAPNLSIDYYRFIWDGEITAMGINPFDFKPNELILSSNFSENAYLNEIYDGISSLSQRNYSCYPPINQAYFMIASLFADNIAINTIVLKLLIVLTELLGAIYLIRILKKSGIKTSRIWLLYLNPLWIVECTGNTHFEGVMISFFFIALYFLLQQKIIIGSFFFAIAVQIKLIPLILLPFFFRYFGFWKSVKFYVITIAAVIAFGFIQLDSSNIENFGSSLRLYFKVFEFNSFVFYHYLQFGFWDTGYNMTKVYGPRLSYIAILLIFSIALIGDHFDWKKLFQRITIGFFIYLLLSNTMHPWYILPLLAFSLFSNFSFPVLWSYLIFFSYILYVYNDSSAIQVRIVSNIEYGLVISLFVYELWKKRTLFQFLNREMISNQQTEG